MKVPYNYLPYEFQNPNLIFNKWRKLIKSTQFTLGPYIEKFEKQFAKYIGIKHCISTNNGTDALILCLKGLGISKGDEVITVSNTFYASVGAIVSCGATPVFVDCDNRYQIDINSIQKAITNKTKAIMPVHWGGASPDMIKINKIAKKNKLFVIEDACMGIGALLNNKKPGTFGIVNAFSMHPLKTLNVMGDGGMVVTNNDRLASWIKKFRNHGMINRDNIEIWGENKRLQPLQAIVASHQLKKVKKTIKKRNTNAKYLDKELKELFPNIVLPPRNKNNLEAFALYMGLFKKRDKLMKYLLKSGIEVKIHYPKPLHLQKAARDLRYKKGSFPVSERQALKLLTLPVHQYLSKKQLKFMVNKIKSFYKLNG